MPGMWILAAPLCCFLGERGGGRRRRIAWLDSRALTRHVVRLRQDRERERLYRQFEDVRNQQGEDLDKARKRVRGRRRREDGWGEDNATLYKREGGGGGAGSDAVYSMERLVRGCRSPGPGSWLGAQWALHRDRLKDTKMELCQDQVRQAQP